MTSKPTDTDTFTYKIDTVETCQHKINLLRQSLKEKKMVKIEYRLARLRELLKLWDEHESEIHRSNYLDLGQSEFTSKFTTFYQVRAEIEHAISNLKTWVQPQECDTPLLFCLSNSYVKPEPFGLTLIFSAWNANYLTLIIPLAQALAAGNVVLAKPAATAKESCKVLMKILSKMNPEVCIGCSGNPEVYNELLKNKFDLIIFTGSADKGKIIAKAAAEHLTPTILELGGQNPVIVDKTANLNTAAHNIIFGRLAINGQACIAPEYIMCDKTIYDKLISELQKRFVEFYGQNPETSENLGKIVNTSHTERILKLINNPGNGAKLLHGDIAKCNKEQRFITPMLFGFDNLKDMGNSELAKAEIFGPVLYIAPYDNINEAIGYINEREKPLSSYLFSNDAVMKERVKEHTSAGCLVINDTIIHFASSYVPFGGVGNSGMGAYHGKWGFDNMSHWKPVVEQSNYIMAPRYPPYTPQKKRILSFAMRYLNYGKVQIKNWVFNAICAVLILYILMKKFKKNEQQTNTTA
jgi:acyl-CoA reductase-like NAD-dependent aldehyde dehydrogenase